VVQWAQLANQTKKIEPVMQRCSWVWGGEQPSPRQPMRLRATVAQAEAKSCLALLRWSWPASTRRSQRFLGFIVVWQWAPSTLMEWLPWGRELLGGNGIVADYNAGRFFADAEALYSYEGTYQMQNLIVGKAITGFSAFV